MLSQKSHRNSIVKFGFVVLLALWSIPSFAELSLLCLIHARVERLPHFHTQINRRMPIYGPGHAQVLRKDRRHIPQLELNAPWPRYHGGYGSTGIAKGTGPIGALAWSVTTGGAIESSAAIAADGTVYVGSDDDKLYAISAQGSIEWTYTTGGKVVSSPAIGDDGSVYVASQDGNLYALTSTGTKEWSFPLGGPTNSSPVVNIETGDIVVGGGDGNLYAITYGGLLDWKQYIDPVSTRHERIDESPASDLSGLIYISEPSADGMVYGFDSFGDAGPVAFAGDATGNFVSSPAVDDIGNVFINVSTTSPIIQTFFSELSGGTLNAVGAGGAYDGNNATLNSPTLDDVGDIFAGTTSGAIDQANPSEGVELPVGIAGGAVNGAPAYGTDGTIYFGCSDGWVYSTFLRANFQKFFQTGSAMTASMAMDWNGTLYIGAANGTLYAIGTVPNVQSVSLSPSTIIGGYSSTLTVNLDSPAPANGLTVYLGNQWPGYVSVPAYMQVPSGQTSGTATISVPALYSAQFTDQITAYTIGSSANTTLTVEGDRLTNFTLSENSIGADGSVSGTVTIENPAPAGGWTIGLAASTPSYVSMVPAITISEGSTSASFEVASAHSNISNIACVIHATDEASGLSAQLTILGDSLSGLTVSPASMGGFGSTTGTVSLNSPAPAPGWTVNLSAGAPGFVTMPHYVTVPTGATSVQFTIAGAAPHIGSTVLGIFANDGNTSAEALLDLAGDSVASLTLTPGTVTRGNGSTGKVTLAAPAPPGGWTVYLKVGAPSLVGVPTSITILAGQQTGTFPITTQKYGGAASVNVVATDNNTSVSQLLTIE